MPKSNLLFEESENEITHEFKNSAVRETTNPGITTPSSSPEATATAPPRNVSQGGRKTKPTPAIKNESRSKANEEPKSFLGFNKEFAETISLQLSNACVLDDGKFDRARFSLMLSVMVDQQPRDHFALMLMNQICGFHDLVMKYIGLLGRANTLAEIDIIERTLNKLARTTATLIDVLQRYQSGGDQRVTVQKVSVSERGKAIVGNITQNAADASKATAADTPAAITDAHAPPMPIIERSEQPITVPAKRRARQ
jgi:hypothetical protein